MTAETRSWRLRLQRYCSGWSGVWTLAMISAAGALVLSEMVGGSELARAALRRPERCGAVQQVQWELARRSYSVGPFDGIFGPKTEFAVRRFQTDRGLSVTGQVNEATAIALTLPPSLGCGGVPATTANYRVYTPNAVLNHRQAPNGTILDRLAHNTSIVVVENSGGWSRLQRGGWVANAYLTRVTSTLNPDTAIANGSAGSGGTGGGDDLYIPPSNGVGNSGTGPNNPIAGSPGGNQGSTAACTHTALVNVSQLNVRNAPSGTVVGSYGEGQAICLTGEGRASGRRFWARVNSGNWVAADMLRLLN